MTTLPDDEWYILVAEDGGWPDYAIGPFPDSGVADYYSTQSKFLQSWGSISMDRRDLRVEPPEPPRFQEALDACAYDDELPGADDNE